MTKPVARAFKIGLLIATAAAVVASLFSPSPLAVKTYTYRAAGAPPTIEQIVDAAGKDLYPQVVAGTLPQLSWAMVLDKIGLLDYERFIPSWLNVDFRFVYDLFLRHYEYQPTGGILLFKYNFTRLDDQKSLQEYTNGLSQYSSQLVMRNAETGDAFEVRIGPFIFSDCVPNNIPKHYCRVFSNDALKANYPATHDVAAAVQQYAAVTDAYATIGLTSPLGPNVDLEESANWTAEQTETYAREIATYMHAHGVVPTLKHLGYNPNRGDAHLSAYRDDRPLKELISKDFRPYYAVNALSAPFFIMTTHFFLTSIDPQNVATRSTRVLAFIRENFSHALVMTDEVSMQGFSRNDTFEQRIAEAKGDVILVHGGLGLDMWSRRAAIYRGALERNPSEARVSLLKILDLKQNSAS